jgi:hypothetical protein
VHVKHRSENWEILRYPAPRLEIRIDSKKTDLKFGISLQKKAEDSALGGVFGQFGGLDNRTIGGEGRLVAVGGGCG